MYAHCHKSMVRTFIYKLKVMIIDYSGNEYLSHVTSSGSYTLRVDLWDFEGEYRWAEYTDFKIALKCDKYRLTIGTYSGDAGKRAFIDYNSL